VEGLQDHLAEVMIQARAEAVVTWDLLQVGHHQVLLEVVAVVLAEVVDREEEAKILV
jgi:hypothetical protein